MLPYIPLIVNPTKRSRDSNQTESSQSSQTTDEQDSDGDENILEVVVATASIWQPPPTTSANGPEMVVDAPPLEYDSKWKLTMPIIQYHNLYGISLDNIAEQMMHLYLREPGMYRQMHALAIQAIDKSPLASNGSEELLNSVQRHDTLKAMAYTYNAFTRSEYQAPLVDFNDLTPAWDRDARVFQTWQELGGLFDNMQNGSWLKTGSYSSVVELKQHIWSIYETDPRPETWLRYSAAQEY